MQTTRLQSCDVFYQWDFSAGSETLQPRTDRRCAPSLLQPPALSHRCLLSISPHTELEAPRPSLLPLSLLLSFTSSSPGLQPAAPSSLLTQRQHRQSCLHLLSGPMPLGAAACLAPCLGSEAAPGASHSRRAPSTALLVGNGMGQRQPGGQQSTFCQALSHSLAKTRRVLTKTAHFCNSGKRHARLQGDPTGNFWLRTWEAAGTSQPAPVCFSAWASQCLGLCSLSWQ